MRSNAVPAVHLGHVKEDFSHHVGALDEAKVILQAVDHALVFDRGSGVLEADGASDECARALHGGHLEADLVAGGKGDVALDVRLREGEEEALSAVLVRDAALHFALRLLVRVRLGGDGADDALLRHDHLGRDLAHDARDRLARPAVVGHLELDGVADLQVLDVAVELAEVEEQAGLTVAALDEAVRVLKIVDQLG